MSVMGFANRSTDCFGFENDSDPASIEARRLRQETMIHIYRVYYGWVPLPLAFLALTCACIYSIACFRAIRGHRVSRKSYVLLLNRSLGDITTCLWTFVIFFYVILTDVPTPEIVQVLDSFFMGCFWAGMTSYVALSFLKLYAVAKPLEYRHIITMRRCIYLICFSWVVFLVMVSYSVGANALSNIESLRAWSGCRKETCLRSFYRFRNTCVCLVYITTLVCFGGTLILIKRHQRFARIHSRKATNAENYAVKGAPKKKLKDRFPLWKLAVNVCTFAIFDVFYVIWGASLLIGADKCYFYRNFNKMIFLLSILHLSILVRITIDPIIAFVTDVPIRRSMLQVMHLQRYIKTYQTRNEDNSSDAATRTNSTSTSMHARNSTIRTRIDSVN
ncbi:unnamed protein product [Bursaphelenchus xylophilus]|nr:unnamed protein product [Bursaphelenchus xylophilus]CAG9122280.1 unnamed protein product [Bursaphelenchus xylophilus]